jgi:hypothetical protein
MKEVASASTFQAVTQVSSAANQLVQAVRNITNTSSNVDEEKRLRYACYSKGKRVDAPTGEIVCVCEVNRKGKYCEYDAEIFVQAE